MTDRYFFKKIRKTQWLGLRVPATLALDMGNDGILKPVGEWKYDDASPVPPWAGTPRLLVLQANGPGFEPVLAPAAGAGWAPFQQSRQALAGAAPVDQDKAGRLAAAMEQAAANPLLPLRLYQAYRDFPAEPKADNYADDAIRLALIGALGGNAVEQTIEAYSELLFITDAAAGPPAPAPEVDDGDGDPARLRVTASQSAAGVTLQLEADGRRITNGNLAATIAGVAGGAGEPGFSPFYRWRRTLGIARRPSADSGAVLVPADLATMRPGLPDGVPWTERPFRVSDRLGAQQLTGELLNYELGLFNAHGRCTHSGSVMLKRQRLDPPAPPLRALAQLLPPQDGTPARCIVTFVLAADQGDPAALEAVVYRQDYPVVPTGFYGDDDDAALAVAGALGDPSGEAFGAAQLPTGGDGDAEALPNLSSHNLEALPPKALAATGHTLDGQAGHRLEFPLDIDAGRATRLFLGVRRAAADGTPPPESQVAALRHETGPDPGSLRSVPHFERFWDPLPAPAWLGEGDARVMLVEDDPAKPAPVRIVIQHVRPKVPAEDGLVGGYRLWMRDIAAPGDGTPFTAVALVQAVPRLVKLYAPIESGRGWTVKAEAAAMSAARPETPKAPGFVVLGEAAPGPVQMPQATPQAGTRPLADLLRELAAAPLDAQRLLAAVQGLRGAGTARDVLLSVAKRRAVGQGLEQLDGNWVLFYDQLGNLLGRAVQFWLPEGHGLQPDEMPRAAYRLAELPGAQDTVALDDFGRAAWTWRGLADLWRHELEWLIEAVPRYAPMQRQRAGLGADSGEPAAALAMAVRMRGDGPWHRLVVPRRQPFKARFGLRQVLDAADDAFVIALDAPHEFRQSLYNSVARTRQGVLRVHAGRAEKRFLFKGAYAADGNILQAWLGKDPVQPVPRPPQMAVAPAPRDGAQSGVYGELVYDEPPCLELTVSVGASADDMHSVPPSTIGPLRRRRTRSYAREAGLAVRKMGHDVLHIDIPMARLDWFYDGGSRPRIGDLDAGGELAAFSDFPLLRLPDPEADMLLFFRFGDDEPLVQVGHFRGSGLEEQDWQTPPALKDVGGPGWGAMRCDLGLEPSISASGDLHLEMTNPVSLPKEVLVCWRCAGLSLPPLGRRV
ncbi:hypothetical protein [Herbaspirillum sp. SJZ107]|uniref:hypothetical protein n=1 Tax=Herbaspirillum sp. SJZ107 TaxID=2572881 RepID=UPI001153D181|nr:hypothetical protein [Herbaspirillum sp. SJZ107]TQK03559.1 hypothetical protein FBX97_5131 [Herbaspirillum sp. SJZ107]